MPATVTAVPRATTLSALRSRHDDVYRDVRRCETAVERLRSELALPPVQPGATPPAERAMITAVRDLVEARARLAQISRELRRAEGAVGLAALERVADGLGATAAVVRGSGVEWTSRLPR